MEALSKIRLVLRRHGVVGLLRRMLGRVWRRRSYVIYSLDCSAAEDSLLIDPATDLRFDIVRGENMAELAASIELACSLDPEVRDYFDDVRVGRAVGVIARRSDRVAHYAFMFKQNKTACLLGLPGHAALIGNAYTHPEFRGMGLQGISVRLRAGVARSEGFRCVMAETAPDNLASQRGMEHAGMRHLGRLETLVLLGALVLRWRRPPGFRLLDVCL